MFEFAPATVRVERLDPLKVSNELLGTGDQ
jgi:hypothetical protein